MPMHRRDFLKQSSVALATPLFPSVVSAMADGVSQVAPPGRIGIATWSFRHLLADKVREGIGDGSVRADADPEAMAVSLVGLLRGIALQLISTPPPARVKAIIDEAERATRHALRP